MLPRVIVLIAEKFRKIEKQEIKIYENIFRIAFVIFFHFLRAKPLSVFIVESLSIILRSWRQRVWKCSLIRARNSEKCYWPNKVLFTSLVLGGEIVTSRNDNVGTQWLTTCRIIWVIVMHSQQKSAWTHFVCVKIYKIFLIRGVEV